MEPSISTIFGRYFLFHEVRPGGQAVIKSRFPGRSQLNNLFLILIQPEILEDVLCQAWNF